MKGDAEKILTVLGKNDTFIIPIYQRPYSWRKEQCRQLFDDIESCVEDGRENHFFGSIVKVPDHEGVIVIDGQQRLTTVSLLLLAIRDVLKEGKRTATKQGDQTADWIYKKFLYSEWAHGTNVYKLHHVDQDEQTYMALFEDPSLQVKTAMGANYDYFKDAVLASRLSVDQLLEGIDRLYVIDITIDKEDNPQLVFESINSTGLDLTEGDKIRNFILMGLDHDRQVVLYEKYWKRIEELTKQGELDGVGLFIRDAMTAMQGDIPNLKRTYSDFKKMCLAGHKITDDKEYLLRELLEYAEAYALLLHPERIQDNDVAYWMGNINRQECAPAYPFLIDVIRRWRKEEIESNAVANVLRMIDAYVFRRLICDFPTNSLNKVFAEAKRQIERVIADKNETSFDDAFAYVLLSRSGKARFPDDVLFHQRMIEKEVYEMRGKNRAYLFSRLENGLSRAAMVSATDDVVFKKVMDGVFTVEHIMPQTLTNEWRQELGSDADVVHKIWKHRLGNLTLTAYNSELSNKSFSEKTGRTLKELKADGFGFDEDEHHISYLNDYVKKQDCWTLAQIEERSALFSDKALQLWSMPKTQYQPTIPDEHAYSIRDHHIGFFTNSKPLSVRVRGVEYKCDSWRALAKRVMSILAEESPEKLRYAADRSLTIRFANHASPQLTMDELVPGVFACCQGSVQEMCMVMQQAFVGFPDFDAEVVVSEAIEEED